MQGQEGTALTIWKAGNVPRTITRLYIILAYKGCSMESIFAMHVLNEERTGFKLRPQSIYGLIG